MASLNAANVDKPIEIFTDPVSSLPDADQNVLAGALESLVSHSADHPTELGEGIHAAMYRVSAIPWLSKLIPGLERLATEYHIGNYVAIRGSDERFFESMPLYARIGMHLLFYGKIQAKLLKTKTVERLLKEQSIRQGAIYDQATSVAAIPAFISTYSLQLDELLYPDISHYKTFNEFFYRQLREGARPVQNADDDKGICSAADCRLVVYPSVEESTKFWIKGHQFNISNLLNESRRSARVKSFTGASVAVFRLAPSDYHRFHSPIDGILGDTVDVPGYYYTVNPQAVCQDGMDVFTANRRSILYMTHKETGKPVAFVAIGALLVGSIVWTGGSQKKKQVSRGEELGYFAYGGSTIVAVFAPGVVRFDEDLVSNSREPVETLVKVGYSIGSTPVEEDVSEPQQKPKGALPQVIEALRNIRFRLRGKAAPAANV